MELWHSWSRKERRFRATFYRPRVERLEDRALPSFITAPSYPTGNFPQAIAVGDLNGDGIPDLVTATSAGAVSVLLGNGDGPFPAHNDYVVGNKPVSVALADLTGSGVL